MKPITAILAGAFMMTGWAARSWAYFGQPNSGGTNAAPASPAAFSFNRLAVLMGEETFFVRGQAETGAALALRYQLGVPDAWPPFSLEAGVLWPHHTAGDFATSSRTDAGGNLFSTNLHELTEEHAALVAELPWRTAWLAPEAALGVSFYQFTNDVYQPIAGGRLLPLQRFPANTISFYDRLGVRLVPPFLKSLSLLVDAGYVNVTDNSVIVGESFPLKLNGWTMRAMLQVRL